MWEAQGGKCALCGGDLLHPTLVDPQRRTKEGRKRAVTLDHIVPRSKCGMNALSNLQLAHAGCNSIRGSISMEGWFLWLDNTPRLINHGNGQFQVEEDFLIPPWRERPSLTGPTFSSNYQYPLTTRRTVAPRNQNLPGDRKKLLDRSSLLPAACPDCKRRDCKRGGYCPMFDF